tara:strand:- start:246 stop:533 length:288 start_codon:yes stop_codon:yes gene_type:complete
MKITKAKLKQIISEELEGMGAEESTEPAAEEVVQDPKALMPIGDWGARVLQLLPNMNDAWTMGVTPEEFVENLQEKLSMEAPTDPLALSYARGEI